MDTMRSLLTRVDADGTLTLHIAETPLPEPAAGQVLVRMEAAPINPSDLGLLLGPADDATLERRDGAAVARVSERAMPFFAGRIGQDLPAGNEGAGTVVAVGAGAEGLMGRTVAVFGGSCYATHRLAKLSEAMPLPEGTAAKDGAAAFVNPLTALAMVETLRMEGHKALIHTAAASNLGRMLNRICLADEVPLINIVRRPEQAEILRGDGAARVVCTDDPEFRRQLTDHIAATGATLAFDAIGGGRLAGQILAAMEAAASRAAAEYSRYGSDTFKQVYIYGALDPGPTELTRSFGFAWSLSGFLLTPFLQKAGRERRETMQARVAAELTTTFRSDYSREVPLDALTEPDMLRLANRKATGEKLLVVPTL